MADYHYVSTWQLQAPIEPVWTAISDLERLPTWYPGVQLATCPPKA
jgi:carbon monoxide dehydrogenase subunit G